MRCLLLEIEKTNKKIKLINTKFDLRSDNGVGLKVFLCKNILET